ncbi:WGR domain-containing protein [Novosphingobium sp. B-7]|uniref:WGR domain-containing protein n=1 Tax=Novosphingobium sp. B-7 TaxID=1298855 RepID=UPI0003B693C2|nr:WGR domain-containing protein [Novosphingobium sp. B-7]
METPISQSWSQSWHWEAIDPSRNVARAYHLWIQTDLFGWTTIERRWGRIGSKGQGVTQSFPEREQAEIAARQVRERRESAFKRIGVAYQKAE